MAADQGRTRVVASGTGEVGSTRLSMEVQDYQIGGFLVVYEFVGVVAILLDKGWVNIARR